MLSTTRHSGAKLLCSNTLPRLCAAPLRPAAAATVLLRHTSNHSTLARTVSTSAVARAPQLKELKINPEYYGAWSHPVYTEAQMESIKIAHREAKTWSDWIALAAVRLVRFGFDTVTGYKHDHAVALGKKDPAEAVKVYGMSEEKWLTRLIFLESIAGVPGMVGGMVRHLQSLRLLRRDNGWIATLLEESQNERMHLLTFLEFRKPGIFMRLVLLGAQGVFFNLFFLAYLVAPRICHRFVGYLEEEAVLTYTRTIKDLEDGKLPKWEKMEAPQIAKDYFQLEPGHDYVLDLLRQVRSDEAKHREVNHTLANIEATDVNPYAAEWPVNQPRPTKGLEWVKQTGWEREELSKIAREAKKAE